LARPLSNPFLDADRESQLVAQSQDDTRRQGRRPPVRPAYYYSQNLRFYTFLRLPIILNFTTYTYEAFNISTTKNYGKDSSTTLMVKPQLPSLLAMIGYPINLGSLTHACKIILANLKKS